MQAKLKCSHCGAEITNLNFAWGKKQWLFTLPFLLVIPLAFFPLYRMNFMKGDITKDLAISGIEKRVRGPNIEIIGLITNQSRQTWQGVNVEAEFFDSTGKFLGEEQSYLSADIAPGANEHFKISVHSSDESFLKSDTEVKVKIASGRTSPF
jgi:hypothetical protein